MLKILPFLAISVVDGLGLVLGGVDTETKQVSLFNMNSNIYIDVAYACRRINYYNT